MILDESLISCGVQELYDFPYNPQAERFSLLKETAQMYFEQESEPEYSWGLRNPNYSPNKPPKLYPVCATIIFSNTADHKVTAQFAKDIQRLKLGTVHKTRPIRNPNSGNMIVTYMWNVNKKNFAKWWRNELRKRA